jgi:hypothetical protein
MMLKQQLTEAVTLSVGYDTKTTTHTQKMLHSLWSTMLKQRLT